MGAVKFAIGNKGLSELKEFHATYLRELRKIYERNIKGNERMYFFVN